MGRSLVNFKQGLSTGQEFDADLLHRWLRSVCLGNLRIELLRACHENATYGTDLFCVIIIFLAKHSAKEWLSDIQTHYLL